MLAIYRRHLKSCAHRLEGRKYRRCKCPIWVDGMLNGVDIRKSLKSRNWEQCQDTIRRWEAEGLEQSQPDIVTVKRACEAFTTDAESRNLRASTLKKYRVLFDQIKLYSESTGLLYLQQWNIEVLRAFRSAWKDRGISACKKIERLRALFRFAHETGWITENPAIKLRKPETNDPPTMPFTSEQMLAILTA